jgi:hypothetical protein
MTAFEMFKKKYEDELKNMNVAKWNNIKYYAEAKKMSIPDYMMMCLAISEHEVNPRKNADVYYELIQMNKDKLIASNRHRNESGHVTAFWLTKKGLKEFNKLYNA